MAEETTFVCISDTHCLHKSLSLPDGDVLVHAGDLTVNGTLAELRDFAVWWHEQPHREKYVIAGNHDRVLDAERCDADVVSEELEEAQHDEPLHVRAAALLNSGSSTYLFDSAATTTDGYVLWGSPWTPRFWGAFQADRGDDIQRHWDTMPSRVDVIVTHCPAAGHRDYVPRAREHVGCADLRRAALQRKPAVLVCGHIHEGGGGVSWEEGVAFANAAQCGRGNAAPAHEPIVFSLSRAPAAEPGAEPVIATFTDPAHRRKTGG